MKGIIKSLIICFSCLFTTYSSYAVITRDSWTTPTNITYNGLPCTYHNTVTFYWAGAPFESELMAVEQVRILTCTDVIVVTTNLNPIFDEEEIIGFEVAPGTCVDEPGDEIDGCSDLSSSENLTAVYNAMFTAEIVP